MFFQKKNIILFIFLSFLIINIFIKEINCENDWLVCQQTCLEGCETILDPQYQQLCKNGCQLQQNVGYFDKKQETGLNDKTKNLASQLSIENCLNGCKLIPNPKFQKICKTGCQKINTKNDNKINTFSDYESSSSYNQPMEGYGTYKISNGGKYEGEWKNGQYNGYGVYYFNNGRNWGNGKTKEQQKTGDLTFHFNNGGVYDGKWENNQYSGSGSYFFSNGRQWIDENSKTQYIGIGGNFEGKYKYGQFLGSSYYYTSNGIIYKNGEYGGWVNMFFSNGDKYVGQWLNGKFNGDGTLYNQYGSIIKQGKWKSGKFLG